jgi:DNA-binding XRE family transcriptional regulator
MKKSAKTTKFKNVEAFGKALGLSRIDMELIRQKKLIISKLKDARLKKGVSQAALAHAAGSKQPAIARMEAGQVSQVSMDFLLKIALILGVRVQFPSHRHVA